MLDNAVSNSPTGQDPPTPVSTLRHPLMKPLLIGLVAVLLALGFAHLGIEVGEGDTLGFDLFLPGVLKPSAWPIPGSRT